MDESEDVGTDGKKCSTGISCNPPGSKLKKPPKKGI